jgi:natural product precursor
MKTVKLEKFAKDKIQERELNYLKGGANGSDDPLHDLLTPPQR